MRLLLVFAAVLALSACAGTTAEADPVATNEVDLPPSYKFVPEAITVPAGTDVTWTNNDNFTHNVDLAEDDAAPLTMAPGESVTHTFDTAGTFAYTCSLHPNDMSGTVTVGGG